MRWNEIINELQAGDKFSGPITPTKGDDFDRMKAGGGGPRPPLPPKRRDERPERPRKQFVIKAFVRSDDFEDGCDFEALDYFEQCSDEELRALHDCGFRSDYPADEVALWAEEHNKSVERVLDYTRNYKTGFEVIVDAADAMVWLTHYRPRVVDPHWDEHMGR